MKIRVIGSGCPTCRKLFETAQKAAAELDKGLKVEYVSGSKGIEKLIELGAISSPALAIDGKIVMTGYTPDISKIKAIILKAKS
ncbi:MAG: thioredoxin family protein [archaeon]